MRFPMIRGRRAVGGSALLAAAATILALVPGPVSAQASSAAPAAASFSTSFETNQPQPTWTSTVDTGPDGKARCSGVTQSSAAGSPAGLATTVGSGPSAAYAAKPNVGFTGVKAFGYSGYQAAAGDASCTDKVFDVDIHVTGQTELSYEIFPQLMNQNLGVASPTRARMSRSTWHLATAPT